MTDWPYGIRRAEPEDAALISSRFSALVGSEGAKQVGAWAAWCQREDHYLYLLEKEQPVGVIAVRRVKEKLGSDAAQAEIIAWYVGETARGHNLGRKLLVHGMILSVNLSWLINPMVLLFQVLRFTLKLNQVRYLLPYR